MTETEQDDDGAAVTDGEADGDVGRDADVASLREELLDEVREAAPDELADELAARKLAIEELQGEVESLEATVEEQNDEIADLTSRLKRKQADFQNYKKRMERKREEEKERATADLVERLLDVRDNLDRALDADESADVRDGLETTVKQFDDVLASENVERIEPEPGDEVDPHRHEVLVRVDAEQPAGTIAEVHRPGYIMAETVLREAQVTVSEE